MTQNEPVVKITLSQIYIILLDTQEKVALLLARMEMGNHEARITDLEHSKWKISGIAGAVAVVTTLAIGLLR